MLDVIIERGGGNLPSGAYFAFNVGKRMPIKMCGIYFEYSTGSGSGASGNFIVNVYPDFISVSTVSTIVGAVRGLVHVLLDGNFNYDSLSYRDSTIDRRCEIRNENGVLLFDNGLPWLDGTYPPDAKNRAGLAGLHAAPTVINPELETALMGDETNTERVQE